MILGKQIYLDLVTARLYYKIQLQVYYQVVFIPYDQVREQVHTPVSNQVIVQT